MRAGGGAWLNVQDVGLVETEVRKEERQQQKGGEIENKDMSLSNRHAIA